MLCVSNVFHIKNAISKFDVIPEHKLHDSKTAILIHNQIKSANNYDLYANTELIEGLSYNFDRKESDLTCYKTEELKELISKNNFSNINILELDSMNATQSLMELEQGKKLWKVCLILALLFLGIEVLLLRYMK